MTRLCLLLALQSSVLAAVKKNPCSKKLCQNVRETADSVVHIYF